MNLTSRSSPSVPSGIGRAVRTSLAACVGAAALLSLSGCYYYPPAYGYGSSPYYATAPAVAPAYAAYPAYPVYPAYSYSYPAVSLGFGGYWGGRHWHR